MAARILAVAITATVLTALGFSQVAAQSPIVGKWYNHEHKSVIDFQAGGVFGFSNAGILTLGAEWLIVEEGSVLIKVVGLGAPPPEVCKFDISGDTLRFSECTLPPVWTRVPG